MSHESNPNPLIVMDSAPSDTINNVRCVLAYLEELVVAYEMEASPLEGSNNGQALILQTCRIALDHVTAEMEADREAGKPKD